MLCRLGGLLSLRGGDVERDGMTSAEDRWWMARQGKSLEKLITHLERTLADSEMVQVEAPKRLRDKSTGRLREHDVVLTLRSAHHSVLVAIECRDRSRPVGVPQLEAFAKKCEETGVGKGVVVSPRGFTKTATEKARSLGIRCLSLDQVNILSWMLCEHVVVHRTTYHHVDYTVVPEGGSDGWSQDLTLETDDGDEMTMDFLGKNLVQIVKQNISSGVLKSTVGDHTKKVRFRPLNLSIVDNASGRSERVGQLMAVAQCTTREERVPFILQEYRDVGDSESIAQIATADLDLGATRGTLVIIQKPPTGGGVAFIPNDQSAKPSGAHIAKRRRDRWHEAQNSRGDNG